MKVFQKFVFCLFFILIPVFCGDSFASEKENTYTSIFYYREGEIARKSLFDNFKSIDILAPQVYSFDKDGILQGGIKPDILTFARSNNLKIMPLVTNSAFGQKSLDAILNDPLKQEFAIQNLVEVGAKENFMGWQVDFEQMDISYRDKFSSFIKKLSLELKKRNLQTSVAVIAQISDNPSDYKNNLWQKLIGVYDYQSLAASSDFISIMSYDDPDSKGPVARFTWLKRVLDWSLLFIPKEKISLGIPLYYWKWDDKKGKIVGIGGYSGLKDLHVKYKDIFYGYSSVEEAPFMKFTDKKKNYTLWYENAKSIRKKLSLIESYDLHGFSAWALGQELPEVASAFAAAKKLSN